MPQLGYGGVANTAGTRDFSGKVAVTTAVFMTPTRVWGPLMVFWSIMGVLH